jgi:cell division protein FtsB
MKMLIMVSMLLAMIGGGGFMFYKSTQNKTDQLNAKIEQLIASNIQLKSNEETLKQGINTANETVEYLENTYGKQRTKRQVGAA